MSSTTAGGAVVEYYSSVPTFIPPTSFSDTGVPTFDPTKTPSPQPTIQDLSSPPSSNHAHPTTPSPPPEPSNPYANDPWAPQANQSIKVESIPAPKSPNLGGQRKIPSRFAVPAPSTGAAGYMRRAATEYSSATSPIAGPRGEQEGLGLTSPVPALSVTPSDSSANAPGGAAKKTGVSKDSLSKSFARLSLSLSGRSKSGKKNSPPSDEPVPRPPQPSNSSNGNLPLPSQHQRPVSIAGSPAPSVRPRSFVIPQTLEEWEAFNKAVLSRPPASHQRPPPPPPQSQSNRLRLPSSGAGMLPGPRLAASLAASPINSPGASPRRSVVDLPPPPIVLGQWERQRLAEAQGIPFPQAPPPPSQQQQQQPPPSERPAPAKRQTSEGTPSSSNPSSRPTTPPSESKRSSLFFLRSKSGGAVSPRAVSPPPSSIPKPSQQQQPEQSPSPSRAASPIPVSLAAAVSSPALVEQPSPPVLAAPIVQTTPPPPPATQHHSPSARDDEPETENEPEPVEAAAALLTRLRTLSLPDENAKTERPHLAIQTDVSSPSLKWSRPKSWMGVMGGNGGGGSRSRRNSVSESDAGAAAGGEVRPRVVSIERQYNPNSNGAKLRALRKSSRSSSIDLTASGGAAAFAKDKDADDKRSLMSDGGRMRNLLKKRRPSSASESGAEGGLDAGKLKKKSQPQPQSSSMGLPPGAARPLLGKNLAVSPGAVSPSPTPDADAATNSATQGSAREKRSSRRFSFGLKNFAGAVQPTAAPAGPSPSPPANNADVDAPAPAAAPPVPAAAPPFPAAAPAIADSPAPVMMNAEKKRSRLFSFGRSSPAPQPILSPYPANDIDSATPVTASADKNRSQRFPFGLKNPAAARSSVVLSPAHAPEPDAQPATMDAEKSRSRRFSFGVKNPAAARSSVVLSPANAPEADAQPAPKDGEKTRPRRFSFGLKNSAPSPANDAEGDGQQGSGEKRRSRKFSFGMKNPFNKSESASASPAPAVNPHALLPPGAARPAIPSRAGSQGTPDAAFSSSNTTTTTTSLATTPPATADSPVSSIKPPSPPPPSSPLALGLSRSANNSSASLAAKMNPFKRKPPPSISDEPFVIVPTLNKGKGKLNLEISDAEKERLERISAPPSLPDSRPQTPSDNTIPVRSFGPGKRGSFFADGDDADKEEKIDERNNRVSRFLNDYAANNELGLAIPSPSLRGMPLAPPSMTDSADNSIAATDSTGHSDGTARVRTPERFEY